MDKFQTPDELMAFVQKLQQLVECKTYNDVTFVCKDGSVATNRLLLAVYSNFLSKLFTDNPEITTHPVLSEAESGINLVDVFAEDLEYLLHVLHSATAVEVNADRIPNLNRVAKQLHIKVVANKLPNGSFKVRPIVRHLFPLQNGQQELDSSQRIANEKRASPAESAIDTPSPKLQKAFDANESFNSSLCSVSQTHLQEMFSKRSYCEVSSEDEFRFKCKICPKKYKFPKDLKSHFKIEHLGVMYTCNLCHAVKYRWPQDVCKHLSSKHDIKDNFMSFYSMVQGSIVDEIDQSYKLSVHNLSEAILSNACSTPLPSKSEFMLEYEPQKPTAWTDGDCNKVCEVPNSSKLSPEELQDMYNTNSFFEKSEGFERSKFQCKLCFKRYKFVKGMRVHFKIAHLGVIYMCNLCNNKYRWPQDVGKHLKKKHSKTGDLKIYYSVVHADDCEQ